jgi:hypothetical protein
MKKIIINILLLLISITTLNAQDIEWKERDEFYNIFKPAFAATENGNDDVIKENHRKLTKKADSLCSSLSNIKDCPKKLRINARLLLEKCTLINIYISQNKYNNNLLYGELVVLHNIYYTLLLDGEKSGLPKPVEKYYKMEEKRYLNNMENILASISPKDSKSKNDSKSSKREKSKCTKCNGSGFDETTKCTSKTCVNGYCTVKSMKNGFDARSRTTYVENITEKKPCIWCLGTQKGLCNDCNGKGWIVVDEKK